MTATLVDARGAMIATPGGRLLFDEVSLRLGRERVALVGRNGVGKSTLLEVLAGRGEPLAGTVNVRGSVCFVPQSVDSATRDPVDKGQSHGERRCRALSNARRSGADILLLDEPTEDLDEGAVAWLRGWLREWRGGLVVASHDRRLLADFGAFLFVSESGCRSFEGSLAELDAEVERDHEDAQRRYVRNLARLAAQEEHTEHVARRKARKKRYGRCRELDRATSRMRLNQKRSDAQVSHGRLAGAREARLEALRQWTRSTRRALGVSLSVALSVPAPDLLGDTRTEPVVLRAVTAEVLGRRLFPPLDLRIGRQRVAVTGPNGAGKTTLLEIMRAVRAPAAGAVTCDPARIGCIAQGGADWMLEESLLTYLGGHAGGTDEAARALVAHKFPLALAERAMRSLSPGERARAALIALFRRSPAVELLILDEPTYSLDLVGQRAMTDALRAWPGGLVVASHDRAFLSAIRMDVFIDLGTRAAPAPDGILSLLPG